jgi:hypothetical protein
MPEPGVWEFRLANFGRGHGDRGRSLEDAAFTFHVEAQGAGVVGAQPSGSVSSAPRIVNRFAPLSDPVLVLRDGVQRVQHITAAATHPQIIDLEVSAQVQAVVFRLDGPVDSGGPERRTADLYVYDCAIPADSQRGPTTANHPCRLWDHAIRSVTHGSAQLMVRWPDAGRWTAVVDALSDSGARGLTLSETLAGPAPRSVGAPWTPVRVAEVLEAASERQEELGSLVDFTVYRRSAVRPVPVGIEVLPATE